MQVASAWSQVQVASAWSQVQVASAWSQVQVASARSQVQLTCEELKSLLIGRRGSADDTLRKSIFCRDWRGRGAKTRGFFCDFVLARVTLCDNRQGRGAKFEVCCDFVLARAILCGDRRGRGAKTRGFLRFGSARATLCGDRRVRGAKTRGFWRAKTRGFLRFCFGPGDPLRGSAWSRCKNSRFFLRFQRLLLFELVLGSCLVVRAPAPGPGRSRVRFPPGPRAGFASCTEQLA